MADPPALHKQLDKRLGAYEDRLLYRTQRLLPRHIKHKIEEYQAEVLSTLFGCLQLSASLQTAVNVLSQLLTVLLTQQFVEVDAVVADQGDVQGRAARRVCGGAHLDADGPERAYVRTMLPAISTMPAGANSQTPGSRCTPA